MDRPPAWLMRQAGRYLPEYRAVRADHSFQEMYRTPALATEVTLQPIRRFGLDAAILFSDILVVPEAMGLDVSFPEGGPVFARTVHTQADVDGLHDLKPDSLQFAIDAVAQLRAALGDETALVGFAGAPYTLAVYAIEGGSDSFKEIKRLEYAEPAVLESLLDRLTDAVIHFLVRQVQAGCDAVQLFDSWGGNLAPDGFERFVVPRMKRIFKAIRDAGGRSIYFVNGGAGLLERQAACGADAVSVDWHVTLEDAIRRLGPAQVVQGNLDPLALLAPPAEVEARVRALVEQGRKARGHIFNVGHGLVPSTPLAGVEAVMRALRAEARP